MTYTALQGVEWIVGCLAGGLALGLLAAVIPSYRKGV